MRGTVGLDAEHTLPRDARRDAAHRARGARHAADFAEQVAAVRHWKQNGEGAGVVREDEGEGEGEDEGEGG